MGEKRTVLLTLSAAVVAALACTGAASGGPTAADRVTVAVPIKYVKAHADGPVVDLGLGGGQMMHPSHPG